MLDDERGRGGRGTYTSQKVQNSTTLSFDSSAAGLERRTAKRGTKKKAGWSLEPGCLFVDLNTPPSEPRQLQAA